MSELHHGCGFRPGGSHQDERDDRTLTSDTFQTGSRVDLYTHTTAEKAAPTLEGSEQSSERRTPCFDLLF